MTDELDPVIRLATLELETFEKGTHYASRDADVARRVGLTQIGASYTEVPPGKSACPFHVHHVEDEMFVILEGRGHYRFGDVTREVSAGDVLGAPRGGPAYAHKLTNSGETVLKYLAISSKSETEVCEYPDSGKFLVSTDRDKPHALRFIGFANASSDYWLGEVEAVSTTRAGDGEPESGDGA